MDLIARYRNAGFEALADGVNAFFDRRPDLQRPGVAFGPDGSEPAKVSTDISLVAIDRSDPEAYALAEVILRGVTAGLERYLQERPLFRDCCPEQQLFVNPIFNLQRYAPVRASSAGIAIGPSAMRPLSPCTACSPGSSTATVWRKPAPNFIGRATMKRLSAASSCSFLPGPRTSIAAG